MEEKTQFVLEHLIHDQDLLFCSLKPLNKFLFAVAYNKITETSVLLALKITSEKFILMS